MCRAVPKLSRKMWTPRRGLRRSAPWFVSSRLRTSMNSTLYRRNASSTFPRRRYAARAGAVPVEDDRRALRARAGRRELPLPSAAALQQDVVARLELRRVDLLESAPGGGRRDSAIGVGAASAIHVVSRAGTDQRRGQQEQTNRFHKNSLGKYSNRSANAFASRPPGLVHPFMARDSRAG